MKLSDIPNLLCIFRIVTVLPIAYFMLKQQYSEAFIVIVIGGVSDWLDGYLARRYNWGSRLGSILDPVADKFFVLSVFALMGMEALLPLWIAIVVAIREFIILIGALSYYALLGRYEMSPTFLSKLNTVVQIVLILVILSSITWGIIPQWLFLACIYLTVVTTVISGADYVKIWGTKALREYGKLKAND